MKVNRYTIVIFVFATNNMRLNKALHSEIEKIELLGLERDLLLDNSMLYYTYNATKLEDFIVFDEFDKVQKMSELLDDDYKIVVRFSYLDCASCISNMLSELNAISKDVPQERILLISEYDNKRSFLAFKESHKITFPIYFCDAKVEYDHILKSENMPYICLLNNTMQVDNLLVPIKEIPIHSKRYYNIMIKRYFSN